MEKVPAASAMEWSIELEKSLRSKNPARAAEGIAEIGQRLERWSREPEPTAAVYNVFGLVSLEDRLFANTILLRLADAFRSRDKPLKLAIVRVFMSMYKQIRRKNKREREKGFLSKARVHNSLELLKRVKDVYDKGDVELRAMALVLFGCWVDFAHDNAWIRYLIFTSLVSSHDLEVRASLFAAACFCEVADDFAAVVLEMLSDMVTSPEITPTIRLAAVRVFAKMGCSRTITNKAFKIGAKIMTGFSEEDILVAFLVSLTKLSSKSTHLASEQADFILPFLGEDKTPRMKAAALRCLHFLVKRGMCYSLVSACVVETLSSLLDKTELLPAMQLEALQILQKIFRYKLYSVNPLEFAQLVAIAEKASCSPIMSSSFVAISALADLSRRIYREAEKRCISISSSSLLSQVIVLILDRITLLSTTLSDLTEVQSLLNLLLLVGEHPQMGVLVLDKISLFLENFVNMSDGTMEIKQAAVLEHGTVIYKGEKDITIFRRKLVNCVYKFLLAYLQYLSVAGAITSELYKKVKCVVECVRSCSFFDCYTQIIYSLLLHSPVIWGCLVNEKRTTCYFDRNSGMSFIANLVECEIFSLECAEKMLMEKDYWSAYRAGIHGTCIGTWVTAAFIFDQLRTKVQSDSCLHWLESLTYLACAEGKIQLLRLPNGGSRLVYWLGIKGYLGDLAQGMTTKNKERDYVVFLHGAYKSLRSSQEALESDVAPNSTFWFQRWFLALNSQILETLVDLLGLCNQDIRNNKQVKKTMLVGCDSLQQFRQISIRLMRLAQELDLIATSFVGIDQSSLKIIADLALSCSLLAFTAGFSLFVPKLLDNGSFSSCSSQNDSHLLLIQNLVGRLWHLDPEISKKLCSLIKVNEKPKSCFHMQPRNRTLNIDGEAKNIVDICREAVAGIASLQNKVNGVDSEEILPEVAKDGLHLLLEIIKKWIDIPFQLPNYFFKIRPSIYCELFAFNGDIKNPDGISVFRGFHLSLDLCLQLRNASQLPSRITKLYCLLVCSVSFQIPGQNGDKEQARRRCAPWLDDGMMEINEKLFRYVTDSAKKDGFGKHCPKDDKGTCAFVRFETNEKGQGFSTCLLDVSYFPEGSYQIKWHGCFIDSQGSYWNLLPGNPGPLFTVCRSSVS